MRNRKVKILDKLNNCLTNMKEISYHQKNIYIRNRKVKSLDKLNSSDKYGGNIYFTILGQI